MNFRNQNRPFDDHAIEQSTTDANILDEDDIESDLENWSIDDYRMLTNWNTNEYSGWKLPGTEEEHWWCTSWQTKGCIHTENHNHPDHQGKAYVKRYQKFCMRSCCRKCYEKWIAREANAATKRMENFVKSTGKTLIHVVLSVSKWDVTMDFKLMKKKARKVLDQIGIKGGNLIFHPFRFNKKLRCWYYSPHFHCVCFGNIPRGKITTTYYESGWVIKYLGTRKSVFATLYYLLAHCGVKKGVHSVSWFGDLSYSKVKKEKEPNRNTCPSCERKLVELYHDGFDSTVPPNQPFEGYVSPEGWYEVKHTIEEDELEFGHSPISQVNEILKSLS